MTLENSRSFRMSQTLAPSLALCVKIPFCVKIYWVADQPSREETGLTSSSATWKAEPSLSVKNLETLRLRTAKIH